VSGRDGRDAREIAASDATAARVAPDDLYALNPATPDAHSVPQTDVTASRAAALGAAATLVALVLLCVAWEAWLAPLRPGGTAFVLKALPLALALPGVLRRRLYTLQWASMLVLFYFAEGIVRGMTDHPPGNRLGWIEAALALGFFACALAYVAPFKRAAKRTHRHRDA
jgi:uncharacterized membrane protein